MQQAHVLVMFVSLNEYCDFLNTTQGLDKLYRLVSYAAKLAATLAEVEAESEGKGPTLSDSFSRLGRNISHTRTVMRLVGLLHNLKLTREWQAEHLKTLKLSVNWKAFRSLTRVLTNYTYLPCDHLAWMGRERIIALGDDWIGFFSRLSAQSWFVGLIVELVDLIKNVRALISDVKERLRSGREPVNKVMLHLRRELIPLLVKGALIAGDLPLSVNYSRREQFMSPLAVGFCGTVSSTAALYLRWRAHFPSK